MGRPILADGPAAPDGPEEVPGKPRKVDLEVGCACRVAGGQAPAATGLLVAAWLALRTRTGKRSRHSAQQDGGRPANRE